MEGAVEEASPGPILPRPPDLNHLFTDEWWALLTDERRRFIIQFEEDHRRDERRIRLKNRRDALKNPRPDIDKITVLSRDVMDSDHLLWFQNYHIPGPANALLGPMRYTSCELPEDGRCIHYPIDMLQIFDVSVKLYMQRLKSIGRDVTACSRIEVYGLFAVRDPLDHSPNYIFYRSRENAQAIDAKGSYLRLSNSARGICAIGCLIEIDIRIKGKEVEEDLPIIDGSVQAVRQFDTWSMSHVESFIGRITIESSIVSEGVEATIDLDFLEVPAGGFHMQLCGHTVVSEDFYTFINEYRRDTNGFVASTGKHGQKFIAAVNMGDTLHIDFMEKRRDTLPFVASMHGNEQQLYRFNNGAVVSVRVYWSTIINDPNCRIGVY